MKSPNREPAEELYAKLIDAGWNRFTGVPCSMLAGLFRIVERPGPDHFFVPAPREDAAVGVATGWSLAEARGVVLMQNSGLGYSLNVFTSLNLIYRIPILVVASWRGRDGRDAVEHDVIGKSLTGLLDAVGLHWTLLDCGNVSGALSRSLEHIEAEQTPSVLIVGEAI